VALEEFRRLGVAAVSCFATETAARTELFRRGFFVVPQRTTIRFIRSIRRKRTDLEKFQALETWYLTMGDGDLELAP
jgi:hypothetical protein